MILFRGTPLKPPDCARLSEALLPVVLAAGAEILRHFKSGAPPDSKSDGSPSTAADRNSEIIITDGLHRIAPGIPVIAEEAFESGQRSDAGDLFFLVDPLDGTREFIADRAEFTVNIGLVANNKPLYGLIYAPALSKLYLTVATDDARAADVDCTGTDMSFGDLNFRKLATRPANHDAPTIITSRSFGSERLRDWLQSTAVGERLIAGSSLKFCMIAEGQADLYPRFGRTMEWDTAAGHAILAAAGGAVCRLDGAELTYGKVDAGFANPTFFASGSLDLLERLLPIA